MAWINLVSERHALRPEPEEIELLVDGPDDIEEVAALLLSAAVSGATQDLVTSAEASARYVHDDLAALRRGQLELSSGRRFADYLTSVVLLHLAGREMAEALRWLAQVELRRDPHVAALQHLLGVALGEAPPGTGDPLDGHDDELEGWTDAVRTAPLGNLVDLALCPDHPAWHRLGWYAAPTVLAAVGGPSGDRDAGLRMLRWATSPERAGELLHERVTDRAPYDPEAGRTDPSYAQGFDAVVEEEGRVACFYNFSMRFAAPWVRSGDLDAFWFLRWIDRDWDTATAAASGEAGRRLAAARNGPCSYRITYDPQRAAVDPAGVRAAAAEYGVAVELVSFLDC
ncbi:hypothetical protein SAMN04515665_103144 [Blastococcus sp. DSM 46786]|uniref:hypothetical protein n=1 Tax=Blastococcus sp. DSM 46786 TaxID=1798227 RepID=UPI0008CB6C80|nr:hypothetical protein [Blastococcus sp. DSM 46786]SEK59970.1 hypothetical protein SAMN04515665_103144 [Blastococcus sp. DSM 46786]